MRTYVRDIGHDGFGRDHMDTFLASTTATITGIRATDCEDHIFTSQHDLSEKQAGKKREVMFQRKLAVLCRRCHAGATRALHEESNTESPDIVQARKGVKIRGDDLHLRNDQHTLRLQHHPSSYAKSTVTPSCSRTKHDLYPTLLKMKWEEGRCRTSASGASHHHTTLLPFTANRCKHNGCY